MKKQNYLDRTFAELTWDAGFKATTMICIVKVWTLLGESAPKSYICKVIRSQEASDAGQEHAA